MIFYKNVEVSSAYGVSKPTVTKWIKDTLEGKKDLELVEVKGKSFIAKTDKNIELIQEYVEQGFKFKPSNAREVVEPKPEFLKYLSTKQRIEIKKNLIEKRHLDMKYIYIDGGASLWDQTFEHSQGGSLNYGNPYYKINNLTIPYIIQHASGRKINVFEIGSGNAVPIFHCLELLMKENLLNSYSSIDISSEMNKIALRNISKKYPQLDVHSYVLDIEHQTFDEIIYEFKQKNPNTINVVILYGGHIGNFIRPENAINHIEDSLLIGDLLYINNTYPTQIEFANSKHLFLEPTVNSCLFAARSMGLKVSSSDLSYLVDEINKIRYLYVTLPSDHTIKLDINDTQESIDLAKGEKIQVWQHRMTDLEYIQSITKPLDLQLVNYALSSDNKFIVTIHRKESRK